MKQIAALCAAFAVAAGAWAGTEVAVGTKISELSFKDARFLPRTLSDFGEKDAYVLFFTAVDCPVAERYLPRISEMVAAYADKNVQFVGVNVGPEDSIVEAAAQFVEFKANFPVVKDFTGEVAEAVGASRTAEVAILDRERVLRYRGRVDDQYRLAGVRPSASRADLQEALDDVLAGNPVEMATTTVDGCAITKREPIAASNDYTFAKDVAPILYNNCVECHRPDGGAPFSLIEYDHAANFASMIAEVVHEERMPPWYAHPDTGDWMNARMLTDEQKKIVIGWAKGNRAKGDLAKLPPLPPLPESKWTIGEPDLVLTAPQVETLPADGYIPYRYITFDYEFPHDTWVTGIEIMPSNLPVVHHANLLYTREGEEGFGFLTGRVPGGRAADIAQGQAMMIPKGARLTMQVHYVTTGKEERDEMAVGIRYASGKITQRLHNKFIEEKGFAIPPGADGHEVVAEYELDNDVTGLALFSHMHLRGKDMTFTAHYPDGKSETLLMVPNYSFDWQLSYLWEPNTVHFPEGTRIEVAGRFDNSAFNPFNPAPDSTVKYGPQTHHEMMIGVMYYTVDGEELDITVDPASGTAIEGGLAGD